MPLKNWAKHQISLNLRKIIHLDGEEAKVAGQKPKPSRQLSQTFSEQELHPMYTFRQAAFIHKRVT